MKKMLVRESINFERGASDTLRTLRIGKNSNNPIFNHSSFPIGVRGDSQIYTDPKLDKEVKEKAALLLKTTPDKLRIPINLWDEVAGEGIIEQLDFYPNDVAEYQWDYVNEPEIEEIWEESKFVEADIIMENDPNIHLRLSLEGFVFIVQEGYGPTGILGTIY